LFVVFCHALASRVGVWFCFIIASFDWLLGQIFLIRIHLCFGAGCFCLESLILAQDERWRRA
jgi:hypothetical protein